MSDSGDLFGARSGREEGLRRARVNSGAWFEHAVQAVSNISGFRGHGEAIRLELVRLGFLEWPPPGSPNVWGSVIMNAKRRKKLVCTGVYEEMRTAKSNARKSEVYIVL